ncbi:hypothetical protein JCM3774_006075 [Rhodotorula dairenensis]
MLGSAALSTPRAAGARNRDRSDDSQAQSYGLAGEEILELTTFAEKQAWIDDKIQFLSCLPRIVPSEPEPPAPPAVTSEELAVWWEEHDRIEREIDEYDMGDLARMRQFARDKSKHALSPRDTDLIEITLTTLFSVDKLLHLLRHRRRALTLLRHRLQWEDATKMAWERYRGIVDTDLPAFLRHAQVGPEANVLSLRSSQRSSISASGSMDLGASIRSLSASTSSLDLASRSSSISNRAQLVQLAHTTLTTNARTLAASLVPAAAASLDKLIDASPAPLPDSFLDAQDRLEEAVAALGDGLDRFAAEMTQQAEIAGAVRSELHCIEQDARSLMTEFSPEIPPDRELLAQSLARLERLGIRLDDVQDQLRSLPRPRHPAVPNQTEQSASLVADLESRLSKCQESLSKASATNDLFRRRLEVYTEVQAALQEMRKSADRLETDLAASMTLDDGGRACDLSLDGDTSEVSIQRRLAGHTAVCDSRVASLSATVRNARNVVQRAARLVNAGREVGLEVTLRQDLRSRADEVRATLDHASKVLEREEAHRQDASGLAAWLRAFVRCRDLVIEAEKSVEERLRLALWREGTPAVGYNDDGGAIVRLVTSAEMAVADMIAQQESVAMSVLCAGREAITLCEKETRELEERARALAVRRSLLDRAREQARAVETVVDSVSTIRRRADSLASEVQRLGARGCSGRGDELASHLAEIDRIAREFDQLRDGLLARVPFLGTSAPGVQSAIDLEAHDANVRLVLNELCISTAGLVESTRRSVVAAIGQLTPASDISSEPDRFPTTTEVPASSPSSSVLAPTARATPADDVDPTTASTEEARSAPSPDTGTDALSVTDDLFSPETNSRRPAGEWLAPLEEPNLLRSLRRRIRAIPAHNWLSPKTLQLPGPCDVEAIANELAACRSVLEDLLASPAPDARFVWTDLDVLRDELETVITAADRVQKLALFAERVAGTDRAFSGLLDCIDTAHLRPSDETAGPLSAAAAALEALRQAAIECSDDLRVQRTVKRVEATYAELVDLLPPSTAGMHTPRQRPLSGQDTVGRNKLDCAVGLVAKAMPFVTIESAEGRWTHESGVYLIGERPCFCRLLRSKQVMVRVGGGWLELSQYVLSWSSVVRSLTLVPSQIHLGPLWSERGRHGLAGQHAPEIGHCGKSLARSPEPLHLDELYQQTCRDYH